MCLSVLCDCIVGNCFQALLFILILYILNKAAKNQADLYIFLHLIFVIINA